MTSPAFLDKALREFPTEVDEELSQYVGTVDLQDVVTLLDATRACIRDLRLFERRVELMVLDLADDREFIVDGVGVVSIKRATSRTKWQHDKLLPVIVALALDERVSDEDGVMLEPSWETVARVLTECGHIDYWRKGALASRGVDADEFSEVQRGDLKVRIDS